MDITHDVFINGSVHDVFEALIDSRLHTEMTGEQAMADYGHYSGLAFLGNIEGWPLGAIDLFICCEWIWKRHNNKGSSQCQKMSFSRLLQCKDSLGGSWRFEILCSLRYG